MVKNVNPVLVAKDSFYLSGAYKNEYYGLLNTDSGTVIPKLKTSDFDKANDTISYIANISNGDLFWLKRRYSYRLYNSQGLMQLEDIIMMSSLFMVTMLGSYFQMKVIGF